MQEGIVPFIGLGVLLGVAALAALFLGLAYRRSERLRLELARQLRREEHAPSDRTGNGRLQALDRVVGAIAHDANSALSAVMMNIDMMQQDSRLQEKHGRRLDQMMKATYRGASLMGRLLGLCREHPNDPDVTCLGESLGDAIELMQLAVGKKVEIEAVAAADLWNTYLDIGAFEIAAIHMATAACAEAGDGCTLRVELENLDRTAAASISALAPGQDHVVFAVTRHSAGSRGAVRDGAGTSAALEAVERFARAAGGQMQLARPAAGALRIALYVPRSLETTTA